MNKFYLFTLKCEIRDIVAYNPNFNRNAMYYTIIKYLYNVVKTMDNKKESQKIEYYLNKKFSDEVKLNRMKIINKIMLIDHLKLKKISDLVYEVFRIFYIEEKIEVLNNSDITEEELRQKIINLYKKEE